MGGQAGGGLPVGVECELASRDVERVRICRRADGRLDRRIYVLTGESGWIDMHTRGSAGCRMGERPGEHDGLAGVGPGNKKAC